MFRIIRLNVFIVFFVFCILPVLATDNATNESVPGELSEQKQELIDSMVLLLTETKSIPVALFRPHGSVGFGNTFSEEASSGFTYGIGGRLLFPVDLAPYRYGMDFTWTRNDFLNESLLRIGIVLERVMFNHLHIAIGTLGFVDLNGNGSYFGITSTLGFETNFAENMNFIIGMQNDLIFADTVLSKTGLVVGIGYQFARSLE